MFNIIRTIYAKMSSVVTSSTTKNNYDRVRWYCDNPYKVDELCDPIYGWVDGEGDNVRASKTVIVDDDNFQQPKRAESPQRTNSEIFLAFINDALLTTMTTTATTTTITDGYDELKTPTIVNVPCPTDDICADTLREKLLCDRSQPQHNAHRQHGLGDRRLSVTVNVPTVSGTGVTNKAVRFDLSNDRLLTMIYTFYDDGSETTQVLRPNAKEPEEDYELRLRKKISKNVRMIRTNLDNFAQMCFTKLSTCGYVEFPRNSTLRGRIAMVLERGNSGVDFDSAFGSTILNCTVQCYEEDGSNSNVYNNNNTINDIDKFGDEKCIIDESLCSEMFKLSVLVHVTIEHFKQNVTTRRGDLPRPGKIYYVAKNFVLDRVPPRVVAVYDKISGSIRLDVQHSELCSFGTAETLRDYKIIL